MDMIDEKTLNKNYVNIRSRTEVGDGGIFVDASIPVAILQDPPGKTTVLKILENIHADLVEKVNEYNG